MWSRLAVIAMLLPLLSCRMERVGAGGVNPTSDGQASVCTDNDGDGHLAGDPALCPEADDFCDDNADQHSQQGCTASEHGRLVAGLDHTCLLRPGGELWCWGDNEYGQLGDSTRLPRVGAVRATTAPLGRDLSAGNRHSCVVSTDGEVWCWGGHISYSLGDGREHPVCVDDFSPHQCSTEAVRAAGLERIVNIRSSASTTLAMDATGGVWGWGLLDNFDTDDGSRMEYEVPTLLTGLQDADALANRLGYSTCIIRDGGDLWCVGLHPLFRDLGWREYSAEPMLVDAIDQVAALTRHPSVFALKQDGTVWDLNVFVQNYWPRRPPQVESIDDAVAITSGADHGCALRSDATVWCWGSNSYGQLGDGTYSQRWDHFPDPQRVPGLVDIVAISAGFHHTCALAAGGAVWCWGADDQNQLGHAQSATRCPGDFYDDDTLLCHPSPELVTGL